MKKITQDVQFQSFSHKIQIENVPKICVYNIKYIYYICTICIYIPSLKLPETLGLEDEFSFWHGKQVSYRHTTNQTSSHNHGSVENGSLQYYVPFI